MMSSILCHPFRTIDSYDDEAYDGSQQGQSGLELDANLAKCSEETTRGEAVLNVVAQQGIFRNKTILLSLFLSLIISPTYHRYKKCVYLLMSIRSGFNPLLIHIKKYMLREITK